MLWDNATGNNHLPFALELARQAVAARPGIVENWEILARLLLQIDETDEALSVLANATAEHPTSAKLYLMQVECYHRSRKLCCAREILRRTSTVLIEDQATKIYRLELLIKTGAEKDAELVANNMLKLDPTNVSALRSLGEAARKNGRSETMIQPCESALRIDPAHTQARYELAVAFALTGNREQARQLISVDHFVTVSQLMGPPEYASNETFQAALVAEITANKTLRRDPAGVAMKGGLQTKGGLPHTGEHAVSEALKLIRSAVDAVEADLPERFEHPFVQRRPRRANLNAWAVISTGDGRQEPHIHAAGWMSGVYYVSAPRESTNDPRSGCLVLGAFETDVQSADPPWGIRHIAPVFGRLVLFPSYLPHATVPTRSSEERICISFDVVPVGPTRSV
jgi:hypothetical protein